MADEIVLNFQDSLLRKSDVKLLENGQWLNDKTIGFMFEYFEYILFNKLENVLFVNPDVAQYIKLCKGAELEIFLEPLNLHSKERVFIPVNSNTNPEVTGGTHCFQRILQNGSLLVYDIHENKFQHYDSCTSCNQSHARQMSKSIEPFLRAKDKISFVEETCPQQNNMHDCGVYVICVTEKLCEQLQNKVSCKDGVLRDVNAESVNKKRSEIKAIINDLKDGHSP